MKFSTHIILFGSYASVSARVVGRQAVWSPPADLVKPLEDVWARTNTLYPGGTYAGFSNSGLDMIMANKGKLNYCVRWDDDTPVTEAERKAVAETLQINVKLWTDNLVGFMGWPYETVDVEVVGWAVRDNVTIQGLTSGIDVYTTIDSSGIPECDTRCGRFFHQDGDYSSCPGGEARHYDVSLWLTKVWEGGHGGDWGQRLATSEYVDKMHDEPVIYLHELGHTFGLLDFYDWMPTGQNEGEAFIMNAHSPANTKITRFDIWMFRDWWRHLATDRYPTIV